MKGVLLALGGASSGGATRLNTRRLRMLGDDVTGQEVNAVRVFVGVVHRVGVLEEEEQQINQSNLAC